MPFPSIPPFPDIMLQSQHNSTNRFPQKYFRFLDMAQRQGLRVFSLARSFSLIPYLFILGLFL